MTDLRAAAKLPRWVWDLVIGLEKAEDEHSALYWQDFKGEWVLSEWCPGTALRQVPQAIRDAAAIIAPLLAPLPEPDAPHRHETTDPAAPAK